MLRKEIRLNVWAPVLVLTLVALPAAATVFTVTLTNGATIDTRYRPSQSPTHADKIMLLTEHGNWISLEKRFVESIESDFESRGYGTVLDTNTIVIGFTLNDAPAPDASTAPTDPTDRLIEYFRSRDQPAAEPFTVPQFVEPNSAGGIPIGFTDRTTPPISSRSGEPPIAGENR